MNKLKTISEENKTQGKLKYLNIPQNLHFVSFLEK